MGQSKKLASLSAAAVVLAISAVALTGCASSLPGDVPDNHFTDATRATFEFNHQRCGGCHEGANRGNLSFEYIVEPGIIQEFSNEIDNTSDVTGSYQIIQEFNSEYMDAAGNNAQ